MGYNSTQNYLKLLAQLAVNENVNHDIVSSLIGYVKPIYQSDLNNRYSEPMLWIGLYIALASLCCILAMVADLVHGLKSRKPWFPCKYFSVNAASLSVISVAMKLPVDLSGSMPGDVDQVAKLGSMAFMCTMMANLLPCLATMDSNELLTNIIALGVLVITMVVNVCIQIETGVISYKEDAHLLKTVAKKYDLESLGINKYRNTIIATLYVTLLLVLLIIHVCSSLAILKSKQIIESKYQQGHETASKDVRQSTGSILTIEKLRQHVSHYWVMSGSGSPQFIIACSVTTTASGVICGLTTIMHTLTVSWSISAMLKEHYDSDYKWSTVVILIVQFIGVILGTVAPLSRCFATLSFKAVLSSFGETTENLELRRYVLQHENEMELAERTLEGFSKSMTRLIQKGEKKQPNNLKKLIEEKSTPGFQGVKKFDNSHYVPALLSEEYQECWSLPVVTLTAIAVTLPDIEKVEVDSLLKSVREGLEYVMLVEENLNTSGDYVSVHKAAETLWQEVDVCHKWLGDKLQDIASQVNTTASQVERTRQIVQLFMEKAKIKIKEGVSSMDIGGTNGDSECKSICANSMSRVTRTIINDKESENELFKELSSWIADIMAACLTNLPQVIAMKCHSSEIEKREACVQAAARLLGETKEMINTLQGHEIPRMSPDDLPFIDKWLAYLSDP
ncbi:hypothetical protein L1987_70190 [Smallanthus sonchifolius]|uniref:Uncharacterized protein n=1 Tax=Smallanthus sonchifolius TaxID=185202 RepID=A0ACB9ANW6_9ASTR|nr:hypothetical protein L1987_70190 [Smallanthus sonchifolius]